MEGLARGFEAVGRKAPEALITATALYLLGVVVWLISVVGHPITGYVVTVAIVMVITGLNERGDQG